MTRISGFLVSALIVVALVFAAVAAATDATIQATWAGGKNIRVKDCGYGLSGASIVIRPATGNALGHVARTGTRPDGCFDVTTWVTASGTWNISASSTTNGLVSRTTVTVP